jgi:hypothetical protein
MLICHSERSEESKMLSTLNVQGKGVFRFFASLGMTDSLVLFFQALTAQRGTLECS